LLRFELPLCKAHNAVCKQKQPNFVFRVAAKSVLVWSNRGYAQHTHIQKLAIHDLIACSAQMPSQL